MRAILMAYVLPPGEYVQRWLPFDDSGLMMCHLNTCEGHAENYELYCNDCMDSFPTTRKEWFLEICPECGGDDVD
tara:strand:- start:30575 stop:30799 length:225 start_codon:yes stop_codon:yes gene_type:complete